MYGDLLEFYVTAVQIFSAGAVTLALISEQFHQRLPPIVEEFINDVKLLRHRMDDVTTRLVQYIKDALLDNKSKCHSIPGQPATWKLNFRKSTRF